MPTAVEDYENTMGDYCRCDGCSRSRNHPTIRRILNASMLALEEIQHA